MFRLGKAKKQLKEEQEELYKRLRVNNSIIEELVQRYNKLLLQWNDLVTRINAKGGEAFLDDATLDKPKNIFDKTELKYILQRCHVDKNQDSEPAASVTYKLVEMLKNVEVEE